MSELVRLRSLSVDDVDHIMTWVNDPEIVGHIAAFGGEPFTREQEVSYVRKILASTVDRVWSIERSSDSAYLGQCGLHQIHWPSKVARVSMIIGQRAHHGQGYGTAAMQALLAQAFDGLGLHKVWLMIYRTNERSRRTYARAGFLEEGVLREEYFHRDGWHDMLRMSLLDREWRAQARGGT